MEGLRVITPSGRVGDQASGSMVREAAVSRETVGAERVWFGFVELPPGLTSAAHHHGDAESGIYLPRDLRENQGLVLGNGDILRSARGPSGVRR